MSARRRASPAVVLSILEPDAEAAARRIASVSRPGLALEIRADRLRVDEVTGLVRSTSTPVIVTVRRTAEGGSFDGSEEERRAILLGALDAGASWIDVEWEGPLAGLADGPHASRVVLSHHGERCETRALRRLVEGMRQTRAARLKVVPRAERVSEVAAIRELLRGPVAQPGRLTAFATGAAGTASRIFAVSWGGWGTYGAAEPGAETADGQLTVEDLLDVHAVDSIGDGTRRFALAGTPVLGSPSPAMHAAAFREAGIDARYVPLDSASIADVVPLAGVGGALALEGLACTVPLKGAAAERTEPGDPVARASAAVNTVLCEGERWAGFNTDGPGALDLLRSDGVDPGRASVAIVGAGGTARAVAAALALEGASPILFSRDPRRGGAAAHRLGLRWRSLAELPDAAWDVLVQATPLGREGERVVPRRSLRGRVVLDAVYGPRETPLVREAREEGLRVIDGIDLLVAQGVRQFERFTGTRPEPRVLESAARRWLAARGVA